VACASSTPRQEVPPISRSSSLCRHHQRPWAVQLADGWVSSSRADLTAIGRSIDVVREAAEQAGRDASALRFVCRGAVRVRPPGREGRRPLTGSFEEIRGDFAPLAAQGVTELFLDLNFDPEVTGPDTDPAASMDRAMAALDAFAPGTGAA
jgi:alkanesulfonate monooxygenase SsuD/methylene tetrahydromethanopterin reductase-like flavin-dependent oxidoreductase (luciferase family)